MSATAWRTASSSCSSRTITKYQPSMSVNGPAFVGMRGNVDCQFFEPRGSLHAIIVLGAGLRDREWFETPDQLCAFTPDISALAAVRSVVSGILQTASAEPHLMKEPAFALALQERLLL